MHIEKLEARTLLAAQPGLAVDLLADTDRNGVIDARDNSKEDGWNFVGPLGKGGIILPNLDRDNTTTKAPDNWTGGAFNGRPAAPNNVIDNAADLADIGRVRLNKLDTDAAYEYSIIVRLLKPKTDPTWFKSAAATDRVRVFFPTKISGADTVPQSGDVAVLGPGLGDTIVFKPIPQDANEYDLTLLKGTGGFFFGVEGLRSGANVRLEVTLMYQPVVSDGPPPEAVAVNTDIVELKVAPFVLNDNRQRVKTAIVDDLTPYGLDNSALQKSLKEVFGTKLLVGKSGDLWQQDGYEIGYVQAPYGAMPVVLELPRSRDRYFSTTESMRSLVRGQLLKAGVGVSTDLAAMPIVDSSTYGGDIESIAKPGSKTPGLLLMSNMPSYMKDYFAAQGVNKAVNLPLDWLAVNHVDEVVQMTPSGKVLVADPDLACALLIWAQRLDPNVRLLPGMSGNEYLDDYTAEGIRASRLLSDRRLRNQNLEYAQRSTSLRGVTSILKGALGLQEEVTTPVKTAGSGTIKLARAGVFTQLLGSAVREFAVTFSSATDYKIRFRDAAGSWSNWQGGKTTRDEVFTSAKAFLFRNYWSGIAKAGDAFTFKTRPEATLLKMPVLFASPGLLYDTTTPT
ncbi:MAG TPA: protein-arginine deiminase family protein, partial [Tepidisphaeraceae bacterium]